MKVTVQVQRSTTATLEKEEVAAFVLEAKALPAGDEFQTIKKLAEKFGVQRGRKPVKRAKKNSNGTPAPTAEKVPAGKK